MAVIRRKTNRSRKHSAAKPLRMELVGRLTLRNLDVAVKRAERSNRPVKMTVVIDPQRPRPKIAIASAAPEASDKYNSVLQAARIRGAERIADILNGEEMLSADAFADEIGATRETVNNKRKRHEILGLDGPKRGIRFPRWQLSEAGELLPGLPELFQALGGRPWAVYRFLLMKHAELGGKRGLDAMRSGHVSEAVEVAKSIATGTFA
jgi:hypothetical protein